MCGYQPAMSQYQVMVQLADKHDHETHTKFMESFNITIVLDVTKMVDELKEAR